MIRTAGLILFLVPVLAGSLFLHYLLPRYTVAVVTGVESKRAERANTRLPEGSPDARDQYLVFLKRDGGSDMVFRNEDTGWGFPPYYKFNAAELQAKTTGLIGKPALIEFYGWRSKIFRIFPNILALDPAPEGAVPTSYTRLGVFSLWGLLVVWLFPRWLELFGRRKKRKGVNPA